MRRNKWILFTFTICGIDCLLPFILACFYPGYDHKTMVLSVLGNVSSPVGTFYDIWMICLGISFLIIGVHIYKVYLNTAKWLRIVLLCITIVYAVFDCIISGFFSLGDSKGMLTTAQKIHEYGSAIGCSLFVFAGLIAAGILWKRYHVIASLLLLDFVLCLVTFTIFVAGENIGTDATGLKKILMYEGLWQRISFVFMYVPYIILCMKEREADENSRK